jgi:hypothetical protein
MALARKILPLVLPSPALKGKYILEELRKEEAEHALDYLTHLFLTTEAVCGNPPVSKQALFNCLTSLYNETNPNLSTVIKDPQGTIVGVGLRYEFIVNSPPSPDYPGQPPYLGRLISAMEEDYKEFYRRNNFCGRVMCLFSTGVNPQYRGHKFAQYLGYGSALLARPHGYTRLMVELTNVLGVSYLKSLGFQVIKTYPYATWEYKGGDAPRFPFKDLDEIFTRKVNAACGYEKYKHAAEFSTLLDASIDDVLHQAEKLKL